MSPTKIRAFGVLPITRRTYLIVQTCCFTVLLAALLWYALSPPDVAKYDRLADAAQPGEQAPIRAFARMLEYAPYILAGAIVAGAAETLWMLRKFKKAELASALSASPREKYSDLRPDAQSAEVKP